MHEQELRRLKEILSEAHQLAVTLRENQHPKSLSLVTGISTLMAQIDPEEGLRLRQSEQAFRGVPGKTVLRKSFRRDSEALKKKKGRKVLRRSITSHAPPASDDMPDLETHETRTELGNLVKFFLGNTVNIIHDKYNDKDMLASMADNLSANIGGASTAKGIIKKIKDHLKTEAENAENNSDKED